MGALRFAFVAAMRAPGRCPSCGDEVVPGHGLCARHLDYHRSFKIGQREQRRRSGLCIQCGAPSGGYVLCERHRTEVNARRRGIVRRKPEPITGRGCAELDAEDMRRWLALGRPKPPPRPAFCASCVRGSSDLEVRLAGNGRMVWLCGGCRAPVGA